MKRKDFEFLAETIKKAKRNKLFGFEQNQMDVFGEFLANRIDNNYPNFNKEKFIKEISK